jgi:hypothetical protein
MMVTIVWNPTGFYQIVALPKGMKFNAEYYSAHILDPLAEWRRSQVGDSDRRLHVHEDHARPHIAEKGPEFLAGNGMKNSPPAVFTRPGTVRLLPFGYIKDRLTDALFDEPDQLLQAIDMIFQSIGKVTLQRVLQE